MVIYWFIGVFFLAEAIKEGIFVYSKRRLPGIQLGLCLGELLLFLMFSIIGVWGWRNSCIFPAAFLLWNLAGAWYALVRKRRKKAGSGRAVLRLLVLAFCLLPVVLFPPMKPVPVSGSYACETTSYVWTDESRVESFRDDGAFRQVAVQFWYPATEKEERFPLVVFSHGAFGYRMSNYSTYMELASNGYVVCSVEHPYHAIFSELEDGQIIMADKDFINDVFRVNEEGMPEEEVFALNRPWINLRTEDMNFVLDRIEEECGRETADLPFRLADTQRTGLMGHSLGGAAAVTVGRERPGVKAVVDLDGTMLGEELDYADGKYLMNTEPYPVPLLCIDTTGHYEEGLMYGDQYVNHVILAEAEEAKGIHFDDAEHMNFTDLPLFSPPLAGLLGTGKRDARECIMTMNRVVLEYFDYYLKEKGELPLQEVY
ncbi:hypothetical protein [Eisenbergiella tayi]|uniref:alpha/beta hydrolase family protein n=1 Tax=Eisenbergiella tayi TaxID=1432052 RepID=UPI00307B6F1A